MQGCGGVGIRVDGGRWNAGIGVDAECHIRSSSRIRCICSSTSYWSRCRDVVTGADVSTLADTATGADAGMRLLERMHGAAAATRADAATSADAADGLLERMQLLEGKWLLEQMRGCSYWSGFGNSSR